MSARSNFLRALAFSILLLPLACQKEILVERRGVMVPIDDAAKADFEINQAFAKVNKDKEAIAGFKRMLVDYAQSGWIDDVYFEMGRIYLKRRMNVEAMRSFQAVIEKYPTSNVADLSRYHYGLLLMQNGRTDEALTMFESVHVSKLDDYFRSRLYQNLRIIYLAKKQNEALFWVNLEMLKLRDQLPPATAATEEAKIKQEVIILIDHEFSREMLEKLNAKLPGGATDFPRDYVTVRLAQHYYQQGDFDKTRDMLQTFLARMRDQNLRHEKLREAEDTLARLDQMKVARKNAVGVLLPLSGKHEQTGRKILAALLLASELLPTGRGAGDLELIARDTAGDAEIAVKAMEELVVEDQVIAVVGPVLKKTSLAAAAKADYYGVPMVSMTQDEGIVGVSPFVFQNCLSKSDQVAGLMGYANEQLNAKRFAALYPQHSYGEEMFDHYFKQIKSNPDLELRGAEAYEKDKNDFGPEIKQLTGLFYTQLRRSEICNPKKKSEKTDCVEREALPPIVDFEALFIPDSFEKMRQIAPALTYYGVSGVQLLGGNLWHSREIFKDGTGDHLQGAVIVDGFDPGSEQPLVKNFVEQFKKETGEEPDLLSAQAFDTMMIVLQAKNRGVTTRDEMRRALATMPPFKGVTGATSFGPDGKAKRDHFLFMIDGDKFRPLAQNQ